MANETGKHIYGSGELHFAQFVAGTKAHDGGFRYIGNTPSFSLSPSSEMLDHFDTDHGLKEKDDSITTSTSLSGSFVTDNFGKENVALIFAGTTSLLTQSSGTSIAETIAAVKLLHNYQLGVTTSNISGVRKVSSVVVTDGATSSPVTYVAGTDYTVDTDLGIVTFLEGGTIAEGGPAKITYSRAAATRTQIKSNNNAVEGALKFISYNAKGPNYDYLMPYVLLSPTGQTDLKGDDWLTMSFDVSVLKLSGQERIIIDGRATAS